MSLFDNVDTSVEASGDVMFEAVKEGGVHFGRIKMAYAHTAASGAKAIHLDFEGAPSGEYGVDVYYTSGTDKGGKNYTEKDGQRKALPGWDLFCDLSALVAGKQPQQLATETRTVKKYNYDAKAELPVDVTAFPELIGKPIGYGLSKQMLNKSKKGADGKYHSTSEVIHRNELQKVFDAETRQTALEKTGNAAATYIDKFNARYAGKVIDKLDKNAPASTGAPAASGGAPKPAGQSISFD